MSLRVETAELGLPALDALDVEALAVYVGPERPLQGLAGFADWRLCGLVSRVIRTGGYDPQRGEALLLPSGGRVTVPRIFCFGLPHPVRDAAEFQAAAERMCVAMRRAGNVSWAGALPEIEAGAEVPAAELFLRALLPVAPRRLVLLGDARALHRDLVTARDAAHISGVEILAPVAKVELPPRTAGLPHSGALVR